jgi:hypothetical protein
MKDLTNPRLIKLKGLLFLVLGLLASALLIQSQPEWKTVALLGIAIWAFCRFYYFAFYVIQHYVDPEFRYSGLTSFFVYLVTHPRPSAAAKPTDSSNITTNKGAAP